MTTFKEIDINEYKKLLENVQHTYAKTFNNIELLHNYEENVNNVEDFYVEDIPCEWVIKGLKM